MWGFGGRHYWGRRDRGEVEGIVVVFAWMSSQDKHLKNYVDLYSSLGWNTLVCHPQFLNVFVPDKATALASEILIELIEELKVRPCPVVFASFSGGPKACMYKVLQIIGGNCDAHLNLDGYRLVRDCICGHVYDSSPVDFTSDLGTRFILHPTVLKISNPPRVVSMIAYGISSCLDGLFLTRFESQRAEYWQTLYSSVKMGAPYLILCSEDDDLAPYGTICNFAQRLQDLGADVKLVKWSSSPHVGHYRHYPNDYKAAVAQLLVKAAAIYSQRKGQLDGEGMGFEGAHYEGSEPFHKLRKAAMDSNESFPRVALELNDHFFVPSSVEYHEDKVVGSMGDGDRAGLIHMPKLLTVNTHGVLGQILFDVCNPKNVEGWDLRSSSDFSRSPLASVKSLRIKCMNPMKCIRRSRL